MDNNKKLLQEINRFRMMSSYQPGRMINEQFFNLLVEQNEENYSGIYEITWSDAGDMTVYLNEIIGTIQDNVLTLNKIGNYIFDKKGYSKTIEQVELLKTQGRLRISSPFGDGYSKMSKEEGKNLNKNTPTDITKDEVKRRYVRQSKKMYKKSLENSINSANWNGKNTGSMIVQEDYPVAFNCGVYEGYLWLGSKGNFKVGEPSVPEYQPVYSGTPTPGDRLEDFEIGKDFKMYKDNMVQPKIYDGAGQKQFKEIVDDFVIYINNGGFDKLTNVTIQGKADSANPTWDIPSGESSLDHNYGGIKRKLNYTDEELDEMNLFLARERARNYKNKLIEAIKLQTGKEITIKELEPISYRGQANKRGGEWRSMSLKANAPVLEKIEIDPVKIQQYNDYLKTKEETEKQLSSGFYPISAKIGTSVGLIDVDVDSEGVPIVISKEEIANSGGYTTKGVYLRVDAVEFYSIPDYPNNTINNAVVNITEEVKGGYIRFTDTNGKTQRYSLIRFSDADYEGNTISLEHRNGGGKWSPYMGGSDFNAGASAQGQVQMCPGDEGKLASSVPFTVVDPQGKQINYKGNYYVQLKNIWFAYTAKLCGDPGLEEKIDYYSVPEIKKVFND